MDLSKTSAPADEQTPAGQFPAKRNLIGQIIVFSPKAYDPSASGKYGEQPQIDAEIILVTGPDAPAHETDWREWGNLAKQAGRIPIGSVGVARVASGPSGTGVWYGLDFDLSDDERDQALAVAQTVLSGLAGGNAEPASNDAPAAAPANTRFPF